MMGAGNSSSFLRSAEALERVGGKDADEGGRGDTAVLM